MTFKHSGPGFATPHSSRHTRHSPRRVAAFTLIETALALLAISLGLIALFGLGRIGLQSSKESENDARCVQMADAIFETLREYNARFVDYAQSNRASNAWATQWDKALQANSQRIPFPPIANMSTNVYWLKINMDKVPAFNADALSLTDWNPRYTLEVLPADQSISSDEFNLLRVSLTIFPDGDTDSSERRIYFTTLTNPGGLP